MLVTILSVVNQAGPKLIDIGINDGMEPGHKDFGLILVVAMIYLGAIAISAITQLLQTEVTGRIAAMVMHDLRVKVFTHLQRLGLDFYTEEKAGVVMTRMTSDIENLQQLLQDGLAQFAVQGLTMIVITIIMFTLDVKLALITLLLVVPALTLATIWFSVASERGYEKVRDGIANVLADLPRAFTVSAPSPRATANVRTSSITATWSVSTAQANNYTAQINAIYGPGTQLLGYLGQAALLGIGGDMVIHKTLSARCPRRVLPLPQPVLRSDPAARPAVQHVPAGTVIDTEAPDPVRRRSRAFPKSPTR